MTQTIVTPVHGNWKRIYWLALPALLVLTTGCGGIHASKSVSPATFLLPGLIKNDVRVPAETMPVVAAEPLLAQAN